jgi:hypothetical protein
MTNGAAREEKSVAARQFARDLAWPRVASRLLDVYASLLTEATVPRLHAPLTAPSATRGL